jgi:hypothetical protein
MLPLRCIRLHVIMPGESTTRNFRLPRTLGHANQHVQVLSSGYAIRCTFNHTIAKLALSVITRTIQVSKITQLAFSYLRWRFQPHLHNLTLRFPQLPLWWMFRCCCLCKSS